MIHLHATAGRPGDLHLWAEQEQARPRTRGGADGPPRHPFAADADALIALTRDRGLPVGLPAPMVVTLPSGERAPLRSDVTGAGSLAAWRVPTLRYAAAQAAELLPAIAADPSPATGGTSIAYFARAVDLALSMLAAGRVLPGLVTNEDAFEARWRAHPDAVLDRRLHELAAAMPPVCRAGVETGSGHPLSAFLDGIVDAIAREALRGRGPLPGSGRSLAARWLRALTTTGSTVSGDAPELLALGAELDAWRRAALSPSAPFRTCFRLEEPVGEEGEEAPAQPWRVSLLLQALEEPSLVVPAEQVWQAAGPLRTLDHVLDHPQEHLLRDLGRASRLWPDLESALAVRSPTELELDVRGAHRFLRETAPLLQQGGYGVLLPSWWGHSRNRLGVRARAAGSRSAADSGTGTGLLGMEGICDYRWEVALGDDTIDLRELRAMASLKVPMVNVRGRWVEVQQDDLRRAIAFFEKTGDGTDQALPTDLLRAALGLEESGTGLPVVGVEAEGWLGDLLGGTSETTAQPLPSPSLLNGVLRPYQERGLGWMSFLGRHGLGACLADDMGLGKTIQLLALLLNEGGETGPTLLVCPTSVVGNWQREAERFAPSLRVHVHHGSGRRRGPELTDEAGHADLVITTYPLVVRDREILESVSWHRIALDEAQHIKNSQSQQAQAVRSLRAPRRVALTGTPVENRLSELWSIMQFLNPGLLGSASDFRRRFAVPIERYQDDAAATALRRLTGPFMLRRLKTDRSIIADLPEKVEMKVVCTLTREQATLYQAVLDDMMERIESSEGIERRGLVLATMTKLQQVLDHPAHFLGDGSPLPGRSGKLTRLEEVLEEALAEGDKALCFTRFAVMGSLLREHLERQLGREVLFLHGGTPRRARDEMVARFQSPAGPPVFVLSIRAGGTGLNLTAANHVIHFDRWWNPAVEQQATDRAFRIGQRRDVQVRTLLCMGTLEERIDRMMEEKRRLAGSIVGDGEGWLTELSTGELRDLVQLSREGVEG
ncbi:MAG TPA: SNF2-related protein [Candidatus Dormibacteraeota bacterium]|jgi:non-specific serine/threonine protein kinase|nr:SNF2-related protein [Candidatus Dormibacteraeota bacterium]